MATKKRTTKAPVKRTAKKTTTKKRTVSTAHDMPSFRIVKDTLPFTHTKFTRQTAYWLILLAVIVIGQLWILKLQLDIATLTDALIVTP